MAAEGGTHAFLPCRRHNRRDPVHRDSAINRPPGDLSLAGDILGGGPGWGFPAAVAPPPPLAACRAPRRDGQGVGDDDASALPVLGRRGQGPCWHSVLGALVW